MATIGTALAITLAVAIPAMRDGSEVKGPPPAAETTTPTESLELRNMFDLHSAGQLAIAATGWNIQQVSLHVLSLSDEPLRFQVPAGAFFASVNPAAQSMIATGGAQEFVIQPYQAMNISVNVACANLHLDIPLSSNAFTIVQTPPQPELAAVASRLGNETYDVRQAAIWIITDNADFDDMGVLTSNSYGNVGPLRVIDLEDAVRAMQIIDAAGVDVRQRRIWRDRSMFLEDSMESDAKTWLQNAG